MSIILRAVNSNQIRYEDLQVSVGRVRLGATAPTWRAYNHGIGSGVTFDVLGFGVNDYINFDVQTRHAMKLDSPLCLHIHFILPNTTNIGDKFKIEATVIGAAIGDSFDTLQSSPFTGEYTIVAGDDTKHGYLDIGELDSINTTVSSIYTVQLKRIAASANEYGSEVYLKYSDCHYQVDDRGSQEEDSK